MKKIDSISDTDEDLDETRRKKEGTDVKDQIVPMSDNKSLKERVDDYKVNEKSKCDDESETVTDEDCQDVPENIENSNPICELDVISSPESYHGVQSECFSPRDDSVSNLQVNYVNSSISNYDEEPYDPEDSLQSYEADYLPDNFITEDSSSLPVSDTVVIQKERNEGISSPRLDLPPVEETADVAIAEDEDEEDDEEDDEEEEVDDEEEDRGEPITRVHSPTANDEIENDTVNSSMSYYVSRKESEEVRCSNRGDTVLVMNRELCSEGCELAKPNICANEEVTYRDHLNSIERVDGIVFHTRNSVIDTGSTSAPVYPCESNIMKFRESQQICDVTEQETDIIARHSGQYSDEYIECPVPKRIYNSVPMPVIDQKSSDPEMYMYNTSVQNMVLCRTSSDCERDIHPANVNGLHAYSFQRVSPEYCPNTNNVIRSFSDPNTDLCSIVQNSNYEDRAIKLVRKIPSEEDFMRRIEKTLFESKIEPREDEFVDSKYKAELDLSLPLKKRLRTLYSENVISPKVDSFPSYRAKPMINIAELLPQTTKTYEENYK